MHYKKLGNKKKGITYVQIKGKDQIYLHSHLVSNTCIVKKKRRNGGTTTKTTNQ